MHRREAQALSFALVFLYRHVLDDPLPWLNEITRATRPKRLPVVLSREEVGALISHLRSTERLVASLLYGAGLRLLEALRLRVKDVDFAANLLIVRQGKGDKDRRAMLPETLRGALQTQMAEVGRVHRHDVAIGAGEVWLPDALSRKYPAAGRELGW